MIFFIIVLGQFVSHLVCEDRCEGLALVVSSVSCTINLVVTRTCATFALGPSTRCPKFLLLASASYNVRVRYSNCCTGLDSPLGFQEVEALRF
jgi:hypothetical protein